MSLLVTQTKIILPARRPDLLSRQRLLDLLVDLLDFKLVIIAAPAGYGKTSLLVDFIHQSDIPACWYSLDPLDKDPQRFITHFIASINRRFPDFGESSEAMINALDQGNFNVERVVTTIVNDVYENIREHFLIVLDDYHLIIGGEEIDSFINNFVQEVGENCHLVLSSRTLLTLPDMPLMVARGLVSGLSYEELAFNAEEIQSLAFQNYRMTLPTQVAVELAEETEGWITGLLLSTHRNWKGDLDQLRAARISGVDLYDYLAQQVLDQQRTEVREFLLRTSLLEEFNDELCKQVLGSNADIPALMETISTNNLFILPVGEDGRWMRYHHLFSEFLQIRMLREHPKEREEILHRLAQVYLEWGEYEKSYSTYKRLGDLESVAKLVTRVGSVFLTGGRVLTLAHWLSEFPEEYIVLLPDLNSLRGAVSMMQGRVDEGILWLRQSEKAQRNSSDKKGLVITLLRLSTALRFSGSYEEALVKASESYSLIDMSEEMTYPRAEALRSLGINLYHVGQLKEAAEKLQQSYLIYQSIGDRQKEALVLMELGVYSRRMGRNIEALSYYQRVLEIWRETHNFLGQANLLNNLGVLHHINGEYVKAGTYFEEGLDCAKKSGYTRMEAYLLSGMGDLYMDLEMIDSAKDAYHRSMQLANECQEHFLLSYLRLKEAHFARLEFDYQRAEEQLTSVESDLYGSRSIYELGLCKMEKGQMSISKGELSSAHEYLSSAVDSFIEAGQSVDAARAGIGLANVYLGMDNKSKAKRSLKNAIDNSMKMDSLHILAVAGRNYINLLSMFENDKEIGPQVVNLKKILTEFEAEIPSIRKKLRPLASTIRFAPPKLYIRAFGLSQVDIDGKVVSAMEWQNQRRVRELFFYILANPQGRTKEEIGAELWPESSESQLKLQFKNVLYRLRYALGADILSYESENYFFNNKVDYVYDVDEFTHSITQARNTSDMERKIRGMRSAVDIYIGHYLADFDSRWCHPIRERLWLIYVDAILALATHYLELGDYSQSLEYSQRLLDDDPCQEEAHRLAMRAFAGRGDRASIIRQFESCRRSLMAEIKAKPSSQTTRLYKSLIN